MNSFIATAVVFALCLVGASARAVDVKPNLAASAHLTSARLTSSIDLWPGNPPGDAGGIGDESMTEPKTGTKPVRRLTNVTKPTLTVFRPTKVASTKAAVIIAPGGGYNILAWDLEGEEVAAWANSIGVTAFILKYRVPRRKTDAPDKAPLGALQDAQRALSVVRSRAAELGLDAKRIGMLGFSAGAHMTAWAATNFDQRAYSAVDAADQVSCRPDFAVMLYPAYLVAKGDTKLASDIRVTAQTPPCFFTHAGDDEYSAENSALMYIALKRVGVPAELHVYARGRHGFGLRPSDDPVSQWPQRCADWMKREGWLQPSARP